MRKQAILKDIENTIIVNSNYQTEIDYDKKKHFATFCYPYMNGKLHLGHAFTMLKADYECRWKQVNGYNVLFPFGFHCTGMPIHAAAMKLKHEFETNNFNSTKEKTSQYDILKNSGIPEENIKNFVDPYYWVKYFPQLGLDHIKKLGIMVDTRRSFVTTDINPFYDSFIKWQFNKLYEKNYLKYGTRNSIYSESLDIQCQDHDRSKGEGVQCVEFKICKFIVDNKTYLIPYESTFENQKLKIKSIIINNSKFNLYKIKDEEFCMTEYFAQNYKYQKCDLELISTNIETNFDNNIKIGKLTNDYYNYLGGEIIFDEVESNFTILEDSIYLPADFVFDRLDKICYVKPIPQWYIDYANTDWKTKAIECVNNMKLNDYTKNNLITNINWLQEWGVSRTFGLGTKLPMDDRFVIDSLSDSTIYMAYYTISHLLHIDIYGKESKYDHNDFTYQVWDYIFYKKWDDSIKIPKEDLDKMNESFEYFYPVDLRISGKDLICNHLCMYIFNHVAIFNESKYPVTINCNGWILVNGEKMSKSKGNFITLEQACEESVDAVRMTLAESGDGVDDANYLTETAKEHNTLKLFTFVDSLEKYSNIEFDEEYGYIETIFESLFNKLFTEVGEFYNNYRYKMVISNAFHICNSLKEKYRIYCKYFNKKQNKTLYASVLAKQLLYLYPIIPHICGYLYEKVFNKNIKDDNVSNYNYGYNNDIINQYEYIEDLVNVIREKLDRLRKKKKPINSIEVKIKSLTDNEIKLINGQIKNTINYHFEDIDKYQVIIS